MRRLIINSFMTIDGVMQAPGGPEEDPSGFTHGGWSFHYWDDVMGKRMDEVMDKPFDLLLGRKTYEIFAAHWPHAGDDDPTARAINKATKYVASRTLKSVEWKNSTLLKGDVVQAVTELKDGDGPEIQVHGSPNLIQTLLKHDLIDEYHLWTFPLVLGTGKRLFADGTIARGLQMVDSAISSTGVVSARYQRGEIKYGSFALEEPTPEEIERRRNLSD